MKDNEVYIFGGVQYSLIDGVVMMRVRSRHEWKVSIVNQKRHDANLFKSHVAKHGELLKQEVAA